MRGNSCIRPNLAHLTILKLIFIGLLELSIDKYKRGSAKDLARFKWELASDDDENFYCYENDSLRN